MRIVRLTLATLALAAVGMAFGLPAGAATSTLTIEMKALNNSGETGNAVLTQESDGVKVVVTLKNAPAAAQPTHIHIGTCGNIKPAPEYALVSLANGTSTSTVKGITIDQLLAGKYAINVHKSADDLGTYVACGEIVKAP
jgi:Cu/Zn superoxide dismutase